MPQPTQQATNTRTEHPFLSVIRTRGPSNQADLFLTLDRTAIGTGSILLWEQKCLHWRHRFEILDDILALFNAVTFILILSPSNIQILSRQ
jgi:hypothetical protein